MALMMVCSFNVCVQTQPGTSVIEMCHLVCFLVAPSYPVLIVWMVGSLFGGGGLTQEDE